MIELKNGRVSLALHTLAEQEGTALLLLHELGGSAQDFRALELGWPGPIYALDLSGHGYSGRLHGGGYYPEMWAADADAALGLLAERHAQAVVLGRGLGAYVALLLAGSRTERIRAAVLCAGQGLFGCEHDPTSLELAPPDIPTRDRAQGLQEKSATDPNVYEGQADYVRPAEYAARFAANAERLVLLEDGAARPAWWRAAANQKPSVHTKQWTDALRVARDLVLPTGAR